MSKIVISKLSRGVTFNRDRQQRQRHWFGVLCNTLLSIMARLTAWRLWLGGSGFLRSALY